MTRLLRIMSGKLITKQKLAPNTPYINVSNFKTGILHALKSSERNLCTVVKKEG